MMDQILNDWIINHLGEDRESYLQSVSPPVFQTSNFCFSTIEAMREALEMESSVPFYTRGSNPTLQMLEKKMAALEGGEAALLFASGSAAIAAAVCSNVRQGDHVVCIEKPYSWTGKLLTQWLAGFGVEVSFVDGSVSMVEEALRPETKVLYLETPNSQTFEIQDIRALTNLVRNKKITTVVDNSYATSLFQKPLALGADIVVHSATKYFSGHSDAVGGVLVCNKTMREKIFATAYMTLGGTMSPMNAWLILRGLRTLPIRLQKSSENGMMIAEWLSTHKAVSEVYYPFHKSHKQYSLAKTQMSGSGGLLSFRLATNDSSKIDRFCNSLHYFLLACSWGGYESLCFPSAALLNSANYQNHNVNANLIRIYCGLEQGENLKEDLAQAFFSSGI